MRQLKVLVGTKVPQKCPPQIVAFIVCDALSPLPRDWISHQAINSHWSHEVLWGVYSSPRYFWLSTLWWVLSYPAYQTIYGALQNHMVNHWSRVSWGPGAMLQIPILWRGCRVFTVHFTIFYRSSLSVESWMSTATKQVYIFELWCHFNLSYCSQHAIR